MTLREGIVDWRGKETRGRSALEGELLVGEVAVTGDGAGVGNEGQKRDEAWLEVEMEEETGRDGDDDGGKREADAVAGEDLQPPLEVVTGSAEDEPLVGQEGHSDSDGKRSVVGDGGDGGAGEFGK